jgi:hypothetical protein
LLIGLLSFYIFDLICFACPSQPLGARALIDKSVGPIVY